MSTSPAPAVPVAILVRVSTVRQETLRQEAELRSVADARGWVVVEVVEEAGVSGAAAARPGLDRVLDLARSGAVRKVLVHEVSRVARRNSAAHAFVEALTDLGVSLYWHAQGLETLLASGKPNPAAGVMFALLAEMARAERETLRERTLSGLEAARRAGKVLGRPAGSVVAPDAFLRAHGDVVRLLRAGQSVRHAAAISGKSTGTVQRVRRVLGLSRPCV
jgi:DNA invertase Pin-like site-specific DNA recombinase